jgi:membrane dipeptidase
MTAERTHTLQREALVLDAHTDTLQRVLMDDADLGVRSEADPLAERADLPRYREGEVNAQIFAVWVDTIYLPNHGVRRAMQQIDAFHRMLDKHPNQVALARTGSDVRRIAGEGKFAALLAIEGGDAIECDLGVLRLFHRLGASSMTLCHSRTTDWVDSSTDASRWDGLNDFGREVVREMNRLRMLVDVSHTSDDAVRDALETSTAPVIASHSSCRTLTDHARNLTDELLQAIAGSGGVIGINFYSGFLDQDYLDAFNAKYEDVLKGLNTPPDIPAEGLDAAARERIYSLAHHDVPRPPFDSILDHIDHAVDVAGIDHVGLGSDLDVPYLSTPEGFDDVTHFPRVTEGLVRRGYSDEDIRKILGENFLRVFSEVTEA